MDVNDTLVLILERIDSPISLIRAASTCRRWRRLIADASFLRRFRSLHGPPVVGHYYNGDYRDGEGEEGRISVSRHDLWFVPSSSIHARHFSLDFALGMSIFPPWMVIDSRGSLLLMECIDDTDSGFPELMVCEPLTQRYKIIPPLPDFDDFSYYMSHGPCLVDGDEDEAGGRIGLSNFRVLCVFFSLSRNADAGHTTMFTASGDNDATWSKKANDHIVSRLQSGFIDMGSVLGSCYFYLPKYGTLITHDCSIGMFSLSKLPQAIKNYYDAGMWTANLAIVDGGDREPCIITIMEHTMEVFARVDGEWGFQNKVLLSKVTSDLPGYQPSFFDKHCKIVKARGVGFVVISPHQGKLRWPFSVDLKTLEVAPAAKDTREMEMGFLCEFPWPPVLQVCVDR